MKTSQISNHSERHDHGVYAGRLERGVHAASLTTAIGLRLFRPPSSSIAKRHQRRAPGFSLIEIMVTVGLLSFIILGLLTMFNQTQRAFRSSMTLTDVLENGRATTDLLVRELEQMTPSQVPFITNGGVLYSTNFFTGITADWNRPLIQAVPGTVLPRVNIVETFFFLAKQNQDWTAIGYAVLPKYQNAGIGALYRFARTTTPGTRGPFVSLMSSNYFVALNNALLNVRAGSLVTNYNGFNINLIADGVVHLKLSAFATNGFLVTTNGFLTAPLPVGRYMTVANIGAKPDYYAQNEVDYVFLSNAVPAAVEVELGMLEPQVYERYRSLAAASSTAQLQFLSNRCAQVHIFRQRIPIRNIDFAAYR